jgi:hypothetical protein
MDDMNEYEPNPEQDTPSVNSYPSGSLSAHTPAEQTIADSLASMQIDEGRANHMDLSTGLNRAPKKKSESKKAVSILFSHQRYTVTNIFPFNYDRAENAS